MMSEVRVRGFSGEGDAGRKSVGAAEAILVAPKTCCLAAPRTLRSPEGKQHFTYGFSRLKVDLCRPPAGRCSAVE